MGKIRGSRITGQKKYTGKYVILLPSYIWVHVEVCMCVHAHVQGLVALISDHLTNSLIKSLQNPKSIKSALQMDGRAWTVL